MYIYEIVPRAISRELTILRARLTKLQKRHKYTHIDQQCHYRQSTATVTRRSRSTQERETTLRPGKEKSRNKRISHLSHFKVTRGERPQKANKGKKERNFSELVRSLTSSPGNRRILMLHDIRVREQFASTSLLPPLARHYASRAGSHDQTSSVGSHGRQEYCAPALGPPCR